MLKRQLQVSYEKTINIAAVDLRVCKQSLLVSKTCAESFQKGLLSYVTVAAYGFRGKFMFQRISQTPHLRR